MPRAGIKERMMVQKPLHSSTTAAGLPGIAGAGAAGGGLRGGPQRPVCRPRHPAMAGTNDDVCTIACSPKKED